MRLFLLGMEHECATRVPDKPLRPFAGTTLFDIYLKKFKALQGCDLFDGQGIALWRGDKRLWKKAEEAGVPIVERSEASAKGHEDYKVIFEFLKDVDAEWILRVSACAPFTLPGTIAKMAAIHQCAARDYALVRKVRKWAWNSGHIPLRGGTAATSQQMRPFFVCTHGALCFRRETMLRTGWCWTDDWTGGVPHFTFTVNPMEAIDIDTEEDFDLARRIAESFTEEEWAKLYAMPTS